MLPDALPDDDDATRIYRPYGSPPAETLPAAAPPVDVPEALDAADPWLREPPAPPDPVRPPPPPAAPFASPAAPHPAAPSPDPVWPDVAARPPAPPAADAFWLPPTADPFPAPADPFRDFDAPPTPGRDAPAPVAFDPYAADPFAPPAGTAPTARPPEDPFARRDPPAADPPAADPPAADPFRPTADPYAAVPAPTPRPPPAPPADDPFRPPSWPAPAEAPRAAPPAADPFAAPLPRDPFAAPPAPPRDPFQAAPRDPFDSGVRPLAPAARAAVPVGSSAGRDDRLAGAFSSVFALVLQLRTTNDFGDPATLRQRAEALIDAAAASARAGGATPADVREAEFCLVAFLDEAVLTSEWSGRDAWAAQPLQLARYDRYDAGEAFFERLKERLGPSAAGDELLEVYYLCLALGYKGRYQIHGREVLRQLVEELQGRLARAPGGEARALSPNARPTGPAAAAPSGGVPTWALFVGAALLVALLYLGLSVSVSGIAREAASDIEALSAAGSGR